MKNTTAILLITIVSLAFIALTCITPATPAAAAPPLQATTTPISDSEYYEIDGRDLVIDHHVSLGDISIVIAVMFVAAILAVYVSFKIVTHYLQ